MSRIETITMKNGSTDSTYKLEGNHGSFRITLVSHYWMENTTNGYFYYSANNSFRSSAVGVSSYNLMITMPRTNGLAVDNPPSSGSVDEVPIIPVISPIIDCDMVNSLDSIYEEWSKIYSVDYTDIAREVPDLIFYATSKPTIDLEVCVSW